MLEIVPFELTNASLIFQQMMDILLGDFPFVKVYLDDVVTFFDSLDKHVVHMKHVKLLVTKQGLKLKIQK